MAFKTTDLVLNLVAGNYSGSGTTWSSTSVTNAATLVNSPTYNSTSPKNFLFNGTSQYLYSTNSFVDPNNFTIAAWIKTTSKGKAMVTFDSNRTGNTVTGAIDRMIYTDSSTGYLRLDVYDQTTNAHKFYVGTSNVADGNWHYVVATVTTTTGGIKLYVDGVLQSTSTTAINPLSYTGWWKFGVNQWGGGGITGFTPGFFGGNLAQATVYSVVLTDTEVLDNYNATLATNFAVPITVVATPITGSGLFVDPSSVVVSTNTSFLASPFTANAEIGNHNMVIGIDLLYQATESTASALFVNPLRFGPDDSKIYPSPLTADGLMTTANTNNTPNYKQLILNSNPSLYIADVKSPGPVGGNGTINQDVNLGYDNWGQLSFYSSSETAASPAPMSAIGNGVSWTNIGSGTGTLLLDNSSAITQSNYFHTADNNHSLQIWFYGNKTNIDLGAIEFSATYNTIRYYMVGSEVANDGWDALCDYTYTSGTTLFPSNQWNNIVVTVEYGSWATNSGMLSQLINHIPGSSTYTNANVKISFWSNGTLLQSKYGRFNTNTPGTGLSMTTYNGIYFNQLALYKKVLSNSEIVTDFNFINSASPNRDIAPDVFLADATSPDAAFVVEANKNIPATPITATALFVNPAVVARKNISISQTYLDASSLFVNPFFYGDPDVKIYPTADTAYAEMSTNNFALDGSYYSYVQSQVGPYRYVTFDSANTLLDSGTDATYSVAKTSVSGSITTPANGLNNRSLKTAALNYTTDGVKLLESEYDDAWGTDGDHYSCSFWIQRAATDTSNSNPRILMNAYSAYNGHYVLLHQYQDKLHLELHNGTTAAVLTGSSTVNVFDYNRHQIFVDFDHTGSTHYVKVYVDSVLKETFDIGTRQILLINGTTAVGPNDEANNYPRLAIGCLITPFGDTSLPATPDPYAAYIDEIFWAKATLNQSMITNLYNAMPIKINRELVAPVLTANNGNIPMPVIGTGRSIAAAVSTATATIVNPQITTDYDRIISATALTATGQFTSATVSFVVNVGVTADYMFASGSIVGAVALISIPGGPMTATAKLQTSDPYFDPYHLLIIQQSLMPLGTSFYGVWGIGDLDS